MAVRAGCHVLAWKLEDEGMNGVWEALEGVRRPPGSAGPGQSSHGGHRRPAGRQSVGDSLSRFEERDIQHNCEIQDRAGDIGDIRVTLASMLRDMGWAHLMTTSVSTMEWKAAMT